MNKELMFSSLTDDWATPQAFFDELNKEFNFTLDPCASDTNHKCEKYYTVESDGLSQNWGGRELFVTHLTGEQSRNGLKRALKRAGKKTRLL